MILRGLLFILAIAFSAQGSDIESLAPEIDAIGKKYQPTRIERRPASLPHPDKPSFNELRKRILKTYNKTEKDRLAKVIKDNFYPELKGIAELAQGKMIAPKDNQITDLNQAKKLFNEIWRRTDAIVQGGTMDAGMAMARLVKKFAQRRDIHSVSKDTDTTPYNDLMGDITNLPGGLAYRFVWAIQRLEEFHNPKQVQWKPTSFFQLGKENRKFIEGFMKVQFASKPKKQASLYLNP